MRACVCVCIYMCMQTVHVDGCGYECGLGVVMEICLHMCVHVCTCHCNGTYLQVLGYMQEQLLLRVLVQ